MRNRHPGLTIRAVNAVRAGIRVAGDSIGKDRFTQNIAWGPPGRETAYPAVNGGMAETAGYHASVRKELVARKKRRKVGVFEK